MLNDDDRKKLTTRLKRVEGQVAGLRRMLDDDTYCVDVLLQLSAAQGALNKVSHLLLDAHVRTCVAEAMATGSAAQRQSKVDELMQVFERYGGSSR